MLRSEGRLPEPADPAEEDAMKAIVQESYGTADVLELEDIDTPMAGSGDVLLRVQAASAFIGDWHVMTGLPYVFRMVNGLRGPKARVRGQDVAGHVEAVGEGVTRFQPGDEVFGTCDGSFAEYATARTNKVAPKPANLTFEQSAAVPTTGSTALQAVRDKGKVKPGQKVLIIGAAGGVGTFAVQIAKAFGAHVTGVCSTTKVDLVRSIGADDVIDYTKDDFAGTGRRYDLILDIAGRRSVSHLRRGPRSPRNSRLRGRRGRRPVVRRYRPPARGADAVAVREPEAGHVRREAEQREADDAQGAHRGRQGHAGH